MELLARAGLLKLHASVLYWLLLMAPGLAGRIVRALYESPKAPQVRSLLRLAILLGPEVSAWLDQKWEVQWGRASQPPDFYWAFKTMMRRTGVSDRRLYALRTAPLARLRVGQEEVVVGELLKRPDRTAAMLSELCRSVFKGHKSNRGACRDLDVIAYGLELQTRGKEIGEALMQDTVANEVKT